MQELQDRNDELLAQVEKLRERERQAQARPQGNHQKRANGGGFFAKLFRASFHDRDRDRDQALAALALDDVELSASDLVRSSFTSLSLYFSFTASRIAAETHTSTCKYSLSNRDVNFNLLLRVSIVNTWSYKYHSGMA